MPVPMPNATTKTVNVANGRPKVVEQTIACPAPLHCARPLPALGQRLPTPAVLIAELAERLPACLFGAQPPSLQVTSLGVQVEGDLVRHVLRDAARPKRVAEQPAETARWHHPVSQLGAESARSIAPE